MKSSKADEICSSFLSEVYSVVNAAQIRAETNADSALALNLHVVCAVSRCQLSF